MILGMTVTTTPSQDAESMLLTIESGQVRWSIINQSYKTHNPATVSVLTNRYLLLPGNRWNRS